MIKNSVCLAALIIATFLSVAAQDLKDYAKPAPQFPYLISPYRAHQVPEPTLANTPRLEQMLKDGKIMLSLSDAIALALENNLDLAIARYNLSIADTDVLRTKSGASVRGVATGLVQGTPGGGIGGFGTGASGAGAGGTSGGAGGAGTGASGLVQSTLGAGAPVSSYDPSLSATISMDHAIYPQINVVQAGAQIVKQNGGMANVNYSQAFPTGSSISVDFSNTQATTTAPNDWMSPWIQSSVRFTFRQRLLSGFGLGPNTRFIVIARNNREISDVSFRNQVIATVSQIQNIYWDLVNAYEDVNVKQRSLALADKTLSDNREQVKLGSLAPIEVTRAESEVSSRNQDLILAQTNLQLQELLMKNAITRNLSDAAIAAAPVLPTDTMEVPKDEPVRPVQDLIADAMAHRPELAVARIDLSNRTVSRKAAANALLPSVDLVSWYGTTGIGGLQNSAATGTDPGQIPLGFIKPTGYGDVFSSLFHNNAPDYAVGISIDIPLRNRAAQADQIRSELEFRQAQLRLQQLQNGIGIEVRNAQFALQQNRARVEAARKARDLAANTFAIEQKKHSLGASTSFQVLQTQRDLAQAELNLVSALAAYEKSRVELDRVTGLTLTHLNIDIQDAEKGQVHAVPQVVGVVPRAPAQP